MNAYTSMPMAERLALVLAQVRYTEQISVGTLAAALGMDCTVAVTEYRRGPDGHLVSTALPDEAPPLLEADLDALARRGAVYYYPSLSGWKRGSVRRSKTYGGNPPPVARR